MCWVLASLFRKTSSRCSLSFAFCLLYLNHDRVVCAWMVVGFLSECVCLTVDFLSGCWCLIFSFLSGCLCLIFSLLSDCECLIFNPLPGCFCLIIAFLSDCVYLILGFLLWYLCLIFSLLSGYRCAWSSVFFRNICAWFFASWSGCRCAWSLIFFQEMSHLCWRGRLNFAINTMHEYWAIRVVHALVLIHLSITWQSELCTNLFTFPCQLFGNQGCALIFWRLLVDCLAIRVVQWFFHVYLSITWQAELCTDLFTSARSWESMWKMLLSSAESLILCKQIFWRMSRRGLMRYCRNCRRRSHKGWSIMRPHDLFSTALIRIAAVRNYDWWTLWCM